MIENKIRFWLRGAYLTAPLRGREPKGEMARDAGLKVFYLPHQRISSSIPFCVLANRETLNEGFHEELIRAVLVPVTTCYGEKGVRLYLLFTGKQPKPEIRNRVIISWVYEKRMSNTYRREGKLFIPEEEDLEIFSGYNGGRFSYTYSVFLTRRDINFSEPDMKDAFVHHRGRLTGTLASAGISISQESWDDFPSPAQKAIGRSEQK